MQLSERQGATASGQAGRAAAELKAALRAPAIGCTMPASAPEAAAAPPAAHLQQLAHSGDCRAEADDGERSERHGGFALMRRHSRSGRWAETRHSGTRRHAAAATSACASCLGPLSTRDEDVVWQGQH